MNFTETLNFSTVTGMENPEELMSNLATLAKNAANSGVGLYCSFPQGKQQGVDVSKLVDIARLPINGKTLSAQIHGVFKGESQREDIYRFFLLSSACYLESPTSRFMGGEAVAGYTKELITANTEVIADWLGESEEEVKAKLKGRFDENLSETWISEGLMNIVRFETDKEGTPKMVRPRKQLLLGTPGIRLMPYGVLAAYIDQLVENLQKDYARIHYLKDSGEVRVIDTTLNFNLLREIYSQEHVVSMLEKSETPSEPNMKKRVRGYITLPEVGLPETDGGTRSVNFLRILKVEYGIKPDLQYVNVDLPSVLFQFTSTVDTMSNADIVTLMEKLIEYGVVNKSSWKKANGEWSKAVNFATVNDWFESAERILGTGFQKKLHLFMLENQNIFSGYTGEPRKAKAGNFDLDESLGLDMPSLLLDD